MTAISIRKRKFGGYYGYSHAVNGKSIPIPYYKLYVLVQDNRRVDSFLYKRNALRKLRKLRSTQSATQAKD